MSRGLGKVQREILDTLDEAKQAAPSYKGGRGQDTAWYMNDRLDGGWTPGTVTHKRYLAQLPDGVYDLRCSLRYLLERHSRSPKRPPSVGFQLLTWKRDPETYADELRRFDADWERFDAEERRTEAYRTAFSRAVKTLIQRGLLVEVSPFEGDAASWDGLDRVFKPRGHRQVRFVRRAE